MLLRPGLDKLLKKVDNKYTLSVLVAKRARQIQNGFPRLINIEGDKFVTIAVHEIDQEKITYSYKK